MLFWCHLYWTNWPQSGNAPRWAWATLRNYEQTKMLSTRIMVLKRLVLGLFLMQRELTDTSPWHGFVTSNHQEFWTFFCSIILQSTNSWDQLWFILYLKFYVLGKSFFSVYNSLQLSRTWVPLVFTEASIFLLAFFVLKYVLFDNWLLVRLLTTRKQSVVPYYFLVILFFNL